VSADEARSRRAVVAAMRRLEARGLNRGTAGNVSVRCGERMLITPTGLPPDRLRPELVVAMDLAADAPPEGPPRPSSEWRLHRDLLRARSDIGAVVHTHAPWCTVLACCHRPIPALHYMIAATGGPIVPLVPYATFGTAELSEAVVRTLGRHGLACLLANHGALAAGPDLARALWLAEEVEELARLYWASLQIGGPVLLPEAEIARVAERFRHYGPGGAREPDAGT